MDTRIFTDKEVKAFIVDGPSKDRLFDGMKYQYGEDDVVIGFKISLDNSRKNIIKAKNFVISSIHHEDSTGFHFKIFGLCDADLYAASGSLDLPYRFEAYYDSKTREGNIVLKKGLY